MKIQLVCKFQWEQTIIDGVSTMYVSSIFGAISSQQKSGATIYSTLDVPLLQMPPNFSVSCFTCRYSWWVKFNENQSLLMTLAPCTCPPFSERFLCNKKVAPQYIQHLTFLWLQMPPNFSVSRFTCRYSWWVKFNENQPLLMTLTPCTCRPFSERFLCNKNVAP